MVWVCLAAITKYSRPGGLNSRHLFLETQFWKSGGPRSRRQLTEFFIRDPFLACSSWLLMASQGKERREELGASREQGRGSEDSAVFNSIMQPLPSWSCLNWVWRSNSAFSHVQLCCDPMDCSPPGFSVHGILQARIWEWVVISFSSGSSRPRDQTQVSYIAGRHFSLWTTREAQV